MKFTQVTNIIYYSPTLKINQIMYYSLISQNFKSLNEYIILSAKYCDKEVLHINGFCKPKLSLLFFSRFLSFCSFATSLRVKLVGATPLPARLSPPAPPASVVRACACLPRLGIGASAMWRRGRAMRWRRRWKYSSRRRAWRSCCSPPPRAACLSAAAAWRTPVEAASSSPPPPPPSTPPPPPPPGARSRGAVEARHRAAAGRGWSPPAAAAADERVVPTGSNPLHNRWARGACTAKSKRALTPLPLPAMAAKKGEEHQRRRRPFPNLYQSLASLLHIILAVITDTSSVVSNTRISKYKHFSVFFKIFPNISPPIHFEKHA